MNSRDIITITCIILLTTINIIDYKTQQNINKGFEIEICITQTKEEQTLAPFCEKHMSDEFFSTYEPTNNKTGIKK